MRASSADRVFVLHQQNDFGPLGASAKPPAGCATVSTRLGDCRQEDLESRPLARFGLATNDAAALLDNSQNRGKAQASSFADPFRGEERLEDVRPHFRVHSDPGVAHGHHRVTPGREIRIGGIGLREGHVGRRNGQRAAFGHGVPRVQGEVHDRAADFARVGPHLPQRGRAIETTRIRSPTRRRSIRSKSATMAFRSSTLGCSTCRRLKASNCWVSDAARSPAVLISSTCCDGGVVAAPAYRQAVRCSR